MQRISLLGRIFGRLTPLRQTATRGSSVWLCRCECGTEKEIAAAALTAGLTVSCGCLWRERIAKSNFKHGKSGTPEWKSWVAMLNRCNSPGSKTNVHYGKAGIKVCDRWSGDGGFLNFLSDMGEKPGPQYSIDRIESFGDYEPRNCRWASKKLQSRNRRNTVMAKYKGVVMPAAEIHEIAKSSVAYRTFRYRLYHGWDVEAALTTPSLQDQTNIWKKN